MRNLWHLAPDCNVHLIWLRSRAIPFSRPQLAFDPSQWFSTWFVPRPIAATQYNLMTYDRDCFRPIAMKVLGLVSSRHNSRTCPFLLRAPLKKVPGPPQGLRLRLKTTDLICKNRPVTISAAWRLHVHYDLKFPSR